MLHIQAIHGGVRSLSVEWNSDEPLRGEIDIETGAARVVEDRRRSADAIYERWVTENGHLVLAYGDRVKEDAISGTNRRLAISIWIPGQAETRTKIVLRRIAYLVSER